MTNIDVRIAASDVVMCKNALDYGRMLLRRFREVGIPVLGTLVYEGVESGEMLQSKSDKLDYVIYRWVPPCNQQ